MICVYDPCEQPAAFVAKVIFKGKSSKLITVGKNERLQVCKKHCKKFKLGQVINWIETLQIFERGGKARPVRGNTELVWMKMK